VENPRSTLASRRPRVFFRRPGVTGTDRRSRAAERLARRVVRPSDARASPRAMRSSSRRRTGTRERGGGVSSGRACVSPWTPSTPPPPLRRRPSRDDRGPVRAAFLSSASSLGVRASYPPSESADPRTEDEDLSTPAGEGGASSEVDDFDAAERLVQREWEAYWADLRRRTAPSARVLDRARLLTVGEWGRGYNRRDAPLASEQEGASPSPRDAREDDREGQASSREAFLFAPRRWSPEHADPSSPEGYFFAPIDDAFAPSPPRTPSPHPQITRGRTGPRDGGGLSPRAIRSLPRASFALHGSSGCASECAVCLRDFAPGEANLTRVPRCAHLFHAECLAPWLMRSSACPRCRGEVVCAPIARERDVGEGVIRVWRELG